MKSLPFCIALALAGCVATPRQAPFVVEVAGASDNCTLNVAERATTLDELLDIARGEVSRQQVATVLGTSETPYRCIGGVIYTLQLAGFTEVRFDTPADPSNR